MLNAHRPTTALISLLGLLGLARPAEALIKADFTPVDLVAKADSILAASAAVDAENDHPTPTHAKPLKGQNPTNGAPAGSQRAGDAGEGVDHHSPGGGGAESGGG